MRNTTYVKAAWTLSTSLGYLLFFTTIQGCGINEKVYTPAQELSIAINTEGSENLLQDKKCGLNSYQLSRETELIGDCDKFVNVVSWSCFGEVNEQALFSAIQSDARLNHDYGPSQDGNNIGFVRTDKGYRMKMYEAFEGDLITLFSFQANVCKSYPHSFPSYQAFNARLFELAKLSCEISCK